MSAMIARMTGIVSVIWSSRAMVGGRLTVAAVSLWS